MEMVPLAVAPVPASMVKDPPFLVVPDPPVADPAVTDKAPPLHEVPQVVLDSSPAFRVSPPPVPLETPETNGRTVRPLPAVLVVMSAEVAPKRDKTPEVFREKLVAERARVEPVTVKDEADPEARATAPAPDAPMLVTPDPVLLILVVPVMVSPPVPWRSPVPELTPTAVTAPAPVTEKLVPVMAWAPIAKALVMLAPEASKAVVIPPAADWTETPMPKTSLVSLFLTKTSWAAGVGLEPSVRVNSVSPVAPAATATVNFWEAFKVSPILFPVVEMVLPAA
jgi:hypothetical protein